jgi:hypothetical protein
LNLNVCSAGIGDEVEHVSRYKEAGIGAEEDIEFEVYTYHHE